MVGGKTHVSRSDGPVSKSDVLRIPRVCTVSIDRRPLGRRSRVHVQVGHGHVLRVGDEGVPELALTPGYAVDPDIVGVPERQGDGPAVLVALVPVLIVPDLAVAVEEGLAVALEGDVLPADEPGGRAAGVDDGDTVLQPVGDVVAAPDEGAVDVDVDVAEVVSAHDLADVVGALGDDNGASLAALLEGIEDLGRVVGCRWGVGRDGACGSVFDHLRVGDSKKETQHTESSHEQHCD